MKKKTFSQARPRRHSFRQSQLVTQATARNAHARLASPRRNSRRRARWQPGGGHIWTLALVRGSVCPFLLGARPDWLAGCCWCVAGVAPGRALWLLLLSSRRPAASAFLIFFSHLAATPRPPARLLLLLASSRSAALFCCALRGGLGG